VIRAGAQLRLARNLRKARRPEAALQVYGDLAGIGDAALAGAPAGLVARHARCVLLEEMGRPDPLREEARALRDDLRAGRWSLERDTYHYYAVQVGRWLEAGPEGMTEGEALARAVDWLWQSWRSGQTVEPGSSGRRSLDYGGTSVTVVWNASGDRLSALAADPSYQRRRWLEPAIGSVEEPGVRIAIAYAEGEAVHGQRSPTLLRSPCASPPRPACPGRWSSPTRTSRRTSSSLSAGGS